MKKSAAKLYLLFILMLALFSGWQLRQSGRIQTDLAALLPQEAATDEIRLAADAANEKQLNGQILILTGSSNADRAFQAASQVAEHWRRSGLFSDVDGDAVPDLDALRADTRMLGAAILPQEQADLLHSDPQRYFRQRAEDATNPFAGSILPLEQDWLGFGRFATQKQSIPALQWQPENGMFYTERDGITWVWLRAKLPDAQNSTDAAKLLTLLRESRAAATQNGYRLLVSGGALFAAEAKTAAERESTIMSAAGTLLTFALLLWVFRSGRVLLLFLPLVSGMLAGLAAALAVFGQVHILTIVIGTSLVGVLVDFPLHWLAPALFRLPEEQPKGSLKSQTQPESSWQPFPAMRRVLPAFLVSLGITVSGYLLLWFTPLPVLRQTAVFSAAALIGAFAATVLWLPALFARYRAKPVPFARIAAWLAKHMGQPEKQRPVILKTAAAAVLLLLLAGTVRTQWHDDIRNWTRLSPDLLAQTKHIADISGAGSSGRFLLVWAESPDKLLQTGREAEAELARRHSPIKITRALHHWVQTEAGQRSLKTRLHELAGQPEQYAPLAESGIPPETVRTALEEAAKSPAVSLEGSLKPAQAEAWRSLYLGKTGRYYAAIMHIDGTAAPDTETARWQNGRCTKSGCVRLEDKRQHLNAQFADTRTRAALLKLLSFSAAWLVLWRLFGLRRGSLILAVPLAAAAAAVGLLGWLGIPVGLFAMFGLLLTAAIGVDYAVYALTARESPAARIGGITLAALTTAISFALLAFSGTPAVAAFGTTVAAGCAVNWLLSSWLAARNIRPAPLPGHPQAGTKAA